MIPSDSSRNSQPWRSPALGMTPPLLSPWRESGAGPGVLQERPAPALRVALSKKAGPTNLSPRKRKGHHSAVPLYELNLGYARARCSVPLRLEAPADAAGDAQVILGLAARC